jgi:uncharacterized repeat protein (TIGR01451 family)
MGPQTPTVYLEKVGPATVISGKPVTYEIVARNTGAVSVCSVHVEEELPTGARFLHAEPQPDVPGERPAWNLGKLEPGAEKRIKIEILPAGEGELTSKATATFSVSSGLHTRITKPRLAITATGPESAQVGEQVIFQLVMTNTGTGPATALVIHDHLPAGLTHDQGSNIDADIGTLAPGESKNLTLQVVAAHSGRQTNEIIATADGGLQVTATATVQVTEALLALRQTGPQRRFLNRPADYQIEVVNPGTAATNNVRITNVLPEGLEFVSASDGGMHEPAAHRVTWKVPSLAGGQKQTFTLKVMAKGAGDLVCRTTAQADRGLEAKAESQIHIEGIPALLLEVASLDNPIEVGAETTYEIRVVNQGTGASNDVHIVATLPDGMDARDASGPTGHRLDGKVVTFEPLAKLAPRSDVIFRVKVAGRQAGDMRVKVQLSSEELKQPITEEESTRVYAD